VAKPGRRCLHTATDQTRAVLNNSTLHHNVRAATGPADTVALRSSVRSEIFTVTRATKLPAPTPDCRKTLENSSILFMRW